MYTYIVMTTHRNISDGELFTMEWKFLKFKEVTAFMSCMYRAGHTDILVSKKAITV